MTDLFQERRTSMGSDAGTPFKDLSGVQWKLLNIRKMDKKKHEDMLEKLEIVLGAKT